MALRRLAHDQPKDFQFTAENLAWAKEQMKKYPEGRQQSAVIPLLWRAQEQAGWLPKPAIERVAELLEMPYIRALEVATFYTMFQLHPVGKHHVQVCTTTPCWLRGSDAIVDVCKKRIAPRAHQISADGEFSWEEMECMGACVNAPMVQIHEDNYEDLTAESFTRILETLAKGGTPKSGPQNSRRSSEPEGGATTLTEIKG